MAAFNKLGSLVRHNALTAGSSAASSSVVFNAARLMSTELYVSGLSWGADDNSLKESFASFGEVTEARVIREKETGRSKGFGFVTFANPEDASTAVSSMDGQEINGRFVRVKFAQSTRVNFGPGGGSRGGGGYHGGGGGGYNGVGSGNQGYRGD